MNEKQETNENQTVGFMQVEGTPIVEGEVTTATNIVENTKPELKRYITKPMVITAEESSGYYQINEAQSGKKICLFTPDILDAFFKPLDFTPEEMQQKQLEHLQDPKNKLRAIGLAQQIQEMVGKNWFPVNRMLKKSNETTQSALQKLENLYLFDLCLMKNSGQDTYFKIILTKEEKIRFLQERIRLHGAEVASIMEDIVRLQESKEEGDQDTGQV